MLDHTHLIAAARVLWGDPTERKPTEWRFGSRGSKSINIKDLTWYDHEAGEGGGVVDLYARAGLQRLQRGTGNGGDAAEPVDTYDYRDERAALLFQVVRMPGHRFFQRRPDGNGWINDLHGVRRVPYRLPQLVGSAATETVFVCEGEKDCNNLARLGFVTTTNPGGAGKWRTEYSAFLDDRDVVILPDNDQAGRDHAAGVAAMLGTYARSVRVLELPGLGPKEDVSDWIARGGTAEALQRLLERKEGAEEKTKESAKAELPPDVTLDDFYAYLPKHWYLYIPTQTLWPPATINSRLNKIGELKAARWLDKHRAVSQMVWAPGAPQIVRNKHLIDGGWIDKPGAIIFNQYHQPASGGGDPAQAGPWLDLVRKLYPVADQHEHILDVLAFKLQHPELKINHALVLGGGMRIGKDTMLLPFRRALGAWNVVEAKPATIMSDFNGYMRCVLLVINETRDLGDVKKHQFYDHMKGVIVTPPETVLINEKHEKGLHVANVCLVIMTTNYRTDGVYLRPDDGRHFVVWSELAREDHEADYFPRFYDWLDAGGDAHVSAWLRARDVTSFRRGPPPPPTPLFYEIVDASMPTETAWLQEVFANWEPKPDVFVLQSVIERAGAEGNFELRKWLENPGNRKIIPHRLLECGYVPVRNPSSPSDGKWRVNGTKQIVYGNSALGTAERVRKVAELR